MTPAPAEAAARPGLPPQGRARSTAQRGAYGGLKGRLRRRLPDLVQARRGLAVALAGLLVFSSYGAFAPPSVRCQLPGAIGCPGGILGSPAPGANATYEQFFNVTMYDYGFWIVDTATGANNTKTWTVYEGWTIHINATSLKADPSQSGTAYHGIGIELNETGRQLLTVNAPVGKWVSGQFTAPTSAYYHQHIWCTIECGPGHGGMQLFNLNIVPATFIPQVTVAATPTSGTAPLTVALTAKVTGGTAPITASWNFGDGTAAGTTLDVNHTYTLSGSYSAKLTVTDSNHNSASGSVAISVTTTTPLSVTAQVTPTTGTAPVLATFSSTASGGSSPYRYSWALGDGGSATGATGSHLYTAPGVYGVVLTVTDSLGSTATASASVSVQGATGSFPVSVTATPASGAAPLAVTFAETSGGGTAPYSVVWVYGDGTFGSGASASHTYSVNGLYEATAYVADSAGHVGSNTTSVSVSGASGATLAAFVSESPSSGSPPLPIAASVSIMGGSEPYGTPSWSFGDGATGTGSSVTHTFTALGQFNVTVQVKDALGAVATAKLPVRVAGLLLTISLNRTGGDAPLAISGDVTIVGGTGRYNAVSWNWGDGTTSTGTPMNHSYAKTLSGSVTVSASVTDSGGASANATAKLTINPPPVENISSDYTTKELPPVNVNFTMVASGGSGVFSTMPLWNFGDGTTTRGPSPQNHTYQRAGHFLVTVVTNDSLGGVANQSVWLNVSGGAATSGGGGTGGQVWTFTGVNSPDAAALALLGVMALSGLALLYRGHLRRAAATKAPKPSSPLVVARAASAPPSTLARSPPPPPRRLPPR